MSFIPVTQRLPKPFNRVWLKTSTGRQTTGYVKSSGEWVISCPRIAAEKPAVISWRE
ncbi:MULTISPECIES: hypothetical protein [unclassified Pantoea]|uniref:hypothetical protein n=1 Tax=unclassified Pantoea TaxID=2630326 RepID=UPI00226A09AB|nr:MULTISPECIES: hypothetical protein [unclassified Pantoea]